MKKAELRACPDCSRRWVYVTEQAASIEVHGVCLGCLFKTGIFNGLDKIGIMASKTMNDLRVIRLQRERRAGYRIMGCMACNQLGKMQEIEEGTRRVLREDQCIACGGRGWLQMELSKIPN